MKKISDIENILKMLDNSDLEIISDKILHMLHGTDGASSCVSEKKPESCPKCHGSHISKFGKDKNGKQRYMCISCRSTFTSTFRSVISHSHCKTEVWRNYISLMLSGSSLHKCAKECGISVNTAFLWRHKIFKALQEDQTNRILGGIVEVDELYMSISYKGNHSKNPNFSMPRKTCKRGTDNRSAIGSKACVMCAVERNGQTYAEVLGKGMPNTVMFSHAFGHRLLSDTVIVSDRSHLIYGYLTWYCCRLCRI